jgi:hypothetical protein
MTEPHPPYQHPCTMADWRCVPLTFAAGSLRGSHGSMAARRRNGPLEDASFFETSVSRAFRIIHIVGFGVERSGDSGRLGHFDDKTKIWTRAESTRLFQKSFAMTRAPRNKEMPHVGTPNYGVPHWQSDRSERREKRRGSSAPWPGPHATFVHEPVARDAPNR